MKFSVSGWNNLPPTDARSRFFPFFHIKQDAQNLFRTFVLNIASFLADRLAGPQLLTQAASPSIMQHPRKLFRTGFALFPLFLKCTDRWYSNACSPPQRYPGVPRHGTSRPVKQQRLRIFRGLWIQCIAKKQVIFQLLHRNGKN